MLYIKLVKKRQTDEAQSLWDEAAGTLWHGMQGNTPARIPTRVKERDQGAFDLPLYPLPIYKKEKQFSFSFPLQA